MDGSEGLGPQGMPRPRAGRAHAAHVRRVLSVGKNYEFPSISLAIEAAGPGDNVVVFPGKYLEAITLTKPVRAAAGLAALPFDITRDWPPFL